MGLWDSLVESIDNLVGPIDSLVRPDDSRVLQIALVSKHLVVDGNKQRPVQAIAPTIQYKIFSIKWKADVLNRDSITSPP